MVEMGSVQFQFMSIFDEHNWVSFFGIWGCTYLFNFMKNDLNLGIKIVSLIILLLFLLDLGMNSYRWIFTFSRTRWNWNRLVIEA